MKGGGSGSHAPAGAGCTTGCSNGGTGTHYTGGFNGSPGVLGSQQKPGSHAGAGAGSFAGSLAGKILTNIF